MPRLHRLYYFYAAVLLLCALIATFSWERGILFFTFDALAALAIFGLGFLMTKDAPIFHVFGMLVVFLLSAFYLWRLFIALDNYATGFYDGNQSVYAFDEFSGVLLVLTLLKAICGLITGMIALAVPRDEL